MAARGFGSTGFGLPSGGRNGNRSRVLTGSVPTRENGYVNARIQYNQAKAILNAAIKNYRQVSGGFIGSLKRTFGKNNNQAAKTIRNEKLAKVNSAKNALRKVEANQTYRNYLSWLSKGTTMGLNKRLFEDKVYRTKVRRGLIRQ